MTRPKNLLVTLSPCLLVLVFLLAPARAADPDPARRAAAMNPYASQFDQMDRVLQLTDEQKTKLKTLTDAMNKELDDLRQDSMARISEAAQDAQGRRQQVNEEIKKANDDFQKLLNTHLGRINAELTPDQRIAWETYKLNRTVMQRLGQVDLTESQRQQLKPLVDTAGKEVAEAKDPAAANAASGKLLKKIAADILTDEQAGKFLTATGLPFSMMNTGMRSPMACSDPIAHRDPSVAIHKIPIPIRLIPG